MYSIFPKESIHRQCTPAEKHIISPKAFISNRKSLEMSANFANRISIRLILTFKSKNLDMIALNLEVKIKQNIICCEAILYALFTF